MLFVPSTGARPLGLVLIPCLLFNLLWSPGCNLGCLKEKQKWTQWLREVEELHQHPRSILEEALKAPKAAVVPYPPPWCLSRPSRSTPANATEPRYTPAPAAEVKVHLFAGAAVSARHLYDPALPTPFPRLPSWDVPPLTARQASAAETRAPPQLFSRTINAGS